MEVLWQELTAGLADFGQLERVLLRLIAATLLGAMVGFEREKAGKPAGFRTHILVALGTAIVVLSCAGGGMDMAGLSRVIQGIVTGIGFIGAGSILKISEQRDIQGRGKRTRHSHHKRRQSEPGLFDGGKFRCQDEGANDR